MIGDTQTRMKEDGGKGCTVINLQVWFQGLPCRRATYRVQRRPRRRKLDIGDTTTTTTSNVGGCSAALHCWSLTRGEPLNWSPWAVRQISSMVPFKAPMIQRRKIPSGSALVLLYFDVGCSR